MMNLEQILNNLVWVVKLNEGGTITGTYNEIEHLMDDCRDMDLAAKQPTDELQDFLDAIIEYETENDWITVPEFYEIYSKSKA